ncbi:MAG: SRPBCC family protein [Acidimicrobiales bacterium]
MREITVQRDIQAPRAAVWAVLADFPNISDWNTGVKASAATSDVIEGLGATRHCELSPMGGLHETIAGWTPESQLVVQIDKASKLPIKSATVTFDLIEGDAITTPTTVTYAYEAQLGMGPMLDRQLTKGFGGFLEDLEKAASDRS